MIYVFDTWRIDTARREAQRAGEPVVLPRRVFDLVVYLIAQRARAVGRDELVSAVWGRVDVADVQISQLIARTRRLLGDDAQTQAAIRTVTGFGYRWIVPVQESADIEDAPASPVEVAATPAMPAPDVVEPPAAATPTTAATHRRRLVLGLLFAGPLLLATIAALHVAGRPPAPPVATNAAIAVLPLEVDAPADADWMQLGVMDLVAGRLRAAGLAVPPSDSVLVALRAAASRGGTATSSAAGDKPPDAERINRILGTQRLVVGGVRRLPNGWRIVLEAPDAQGLPHRVEAERGDPIAAGRDAADLLLAALGHARTASAEDGATELVIQRSQAAILAGRFDVAQEILDAAASDQQAAPRVQLQYAQIDFYRGRLDDAARKLDAVLGGDPAPELRARALTSRGMLLMRRGDCAAAEDSFGTALAAPSAVDAIALAGRGLARSCSFEHASAVDDLGLARLRFEAAGDRLGVARVDNYLAIADANRNRLEPSLARFDAALATYESFGVADAQRAALSGLLDVHVQLLRWQDAGRDASRLAALRSRIADEGQRQTLDSDRARALVGLGRLREAAELVEPDGATGVADAAARRYREATRAELAWRQGRTDLARAAAERALLDWPPRVDDVRRASIVLLRQRAGGPPASDTPDAGAGRPLLRLAEAEAAPADERYRAALDEADALGIPGVVAEVAASYVAWLMRRGRLDDAAALSGRIAPWSTYDFDCAQLRVALFHARGDREAWEAALERARGLAGERPIAAALLVPPVAANVRNVMQ